MTIDIDAARRLTRAAVIGRVGKKLGTVAAVYYDNHTDEPEWVGVRTGADPPDTGRPELRPGPAGTVQSKAGSNS